MIHTQYAKKIKCIHTDNGNEYVNSFMDEFTKYRRLNTKPCVQEFLNKIELAKEKQIHLEYS